MKYYLYRHIRLDTNEPFYIGIGTKSNVNHKTMKSEYNRAYDKCKRSTFWKNTTSKTQYEVEILFEHDNYEFIENKEIEFVALYGRRNLGLGTLVNLTNGGDGNKGVVHTEEMRYNKRESIKNSRVIQETKRILCEKRTGEKFISKQGQEYTIVAYRSTKSCDIQFEDGTIVENKAYGDIKRREVSNPNYPSYFGTGYIGQGEYKAKQQDGKSEKAFTLWLTLQKEVVESKMKILFFEPWKNYQIFAKWYEEKHIEEFVVNRTLIQKENKEYSPNTCFFVPDEINILKNEKGKRNKTGYIGAVKLGKKYRVMFNKKHVGLYDTPEEASDAYKQVKEKHTKELAEKWKIKIDLQIYNYLLNYKVEVTK